jgi:hypothetical protein
MRNLYRQEIQKHATELIQRLRLIAYSYYKVAQNIENHFAYQELDCITTENVRKVRNDLNRIRIPFQQNRNLAHPNDDLIQQFDQSLKLNNINPAGYQRRKLLYLIRSKAHDDLEEVERLERQFDLQRRNDQENNEELNIFGQDINLLTEGLMQGITVIRNGIHIEEINANRLEGNLNESLTHINDRVLNVNNLSILNMNESPNFSTTLEDSSLNREKLNRLDLFYRRCLLILQRVRQNVNLILQIA